MTHGPHSRIALVANSSWYLYNFRRSLAAALQADGHEVFAVAPAGGYESRLAEAGLNVRPIPLSRAGTNPLRELETVRALRRVFRSDEVDTIFGFTPKGNIYSGFAAIGLKAQFVPNVSGLGQAFVANSRLRHIAGPLFKLAFLRAETVLFQNGDDLRQFVQAGLTTACKADRIPGSGVDLTRFAPAAAQRADAEAGPTFLLIARLLWSKGLGEYAAAARAIHASLPSARFQVLGPLEEPGRGGVPKETLDEWARDGLIEYLGTTDDVRPYIAAADCVVLPSFYREGVPRSLLEASAMGRPIVTTDMPGCRDAVDDGINGFMCKPQNAADLEDKLRAIAMLAPDSRHRMGTLGRAKMEREFDERIVIDRYRDLAGRIHA